MLRADRDALNRARAVAWRPPADEREHFERCPACGQAIDLRRLGDVLHHDEQGHEPLALDS